MFTYNTRTELLPEGTRFIEKDIILFDYSYTGDIAFQVDVLLSTPGFGFVIQEDDGGDKQTSDNIVLVTFSNDNSYRVILKNGGEQATVINQFVEAPVNLYDENGITLFFRKHNEILSVYKGIRMTDGHFEELKLMTYHMQYDMDNYWIGIYSNSGNIVRFASVQTEAPSNWVTNVINAGGGRVKWIKDGFTIDEAEYDIEVESMDIPMNAGTYWFDYETDNPEMEAYVYPAPRKDTNDKRQREDILNTMKDEEKNILEKDGRFVLPAECTINLKFKGKWGTVRNICIKNDKRESFIETGYDSTVRPGSRLRFDLSKISKIHIKGKILEIPFADAGESRPYSIFRRGQFNIPLTGEMRLNKEHVFEFDTKDNILTVDGNHVETLSDPSMLLYAFENVTADIYEFIVTTADGEEVNILLQRTLRTTVTNTIDSPIIVTDENDEPLDLSSSYRLLAVTKQKLELFNALNGITLSCYPDITDKKGIHVYGIPYSMQIENGQRKPIINKNAETIQEMAEQYTEIPYTYDPAMLLKKIIKIPYSIRSKYQYIAVSYKAIEDKRYIFTNWAREIYDLEESQRIYLSAPALDLKTEVIVRGIADKNLLNKDLLYYIPDDDFETSIDLAAAEYTILNKDNDEYKINKLQKVIVDTDTLKKYKYLIIDYLKQDSYAINERDDKYLIDITPTGTVIHIYYDADEETGMTTQKYSVIKVDDITGKNDGAEYPEMQNGDFVALELTE